MNLKGTPMQPDHDNALTFDALRAANVTRCNKWHPGGIASWSASDWLTAIAGEMGELASLIKMLNRERDGLVGNKFVPTEKQIADELADVLTYLDLLAAWFGIDLGRAVAEKFNEVSVRVGFPDRIELAPNRPIGDSRCTPAQNEEGGPGDYYVLVHPWAVYVKEGEFFKSQGGLTAKWGQAWRCVRATSIEDARQKGEELRAAGRFLS